MDCSAPGSSVHEISQPRKLECFSRASSEPSIEPASLSFFFFFFLNLHLLHWQMDSLPLSYQGILAKWSLGINRNEMRSESCTYLGERPFQVRETE